MHKNVEHWKEKKFELEQRIKQLEQLRDKTNVWLEKVSLKKDLSKYQEEHERLTQLQHKLKPTVKDYTKKLRYAKEELHLTNRNIKRQNKAVPIVIALALIALIGLSTYLTEPTITGLIIGEEMHKENISLNITKDDITSLSKEDITIQLSAEINKPVKWIKKIKLDRPVNNLKIKLPENAVDINITKISDGANETIDKEYVRIKEFAATETELIIQDNVSEVEIEYYTEAPKVMEKEISEYRKEITIYSDTHYINIISYTTIPDSNKESIKLYRTTNGIKEPTEIIDYADENNNSLIDKISWIVPSLSNETYEVEIIILNVQSYPTVGGNWEVGFTTKGTANLTITSIDETTWSDENEDNDLKFLEVRCGENIQSYQWTGNSVFIQDYECNNKTGYETSKVLTPGKHHLEFDFGGIKAYASNDADMFETGIVETDGWTIVNTKRTYIVPIVIASPKEGFETSTDLEVSTAVITNITPNSFKVQLYNESNGALAGNVSYIVVENGTHTLSNGLLLQAGRVEDISSYNADGAGGTSYQTITFWTAYSSAPVVVASPNNDSAQDWVATRYNTGTLTTTGIDISLEIDSTYGTAPIAASGVGSGETNSLAWIAINRTSAVDMEAALEAAVDEDPATGDWRTLTFSNTYTTPIFFGLGEESGGTDTTTVGIQNLATGSVDIRRTEERTDGEQTHATEDTLWMVFESGLGNTASTAPTNVQCNDNDNCNISVDISVILNASGSTDVDGDNITYFIEASLLNTTSTDNQESGEKQVIAATGGTVIGETGNVIVSDSLVWTWVSYQGTYSSAPVVIATPVTYTNCAGTCSGTSAGNGGMYPIPAVKDVSTAGFNFSMCIDGGSATCTTGASSETFDYFVFDVDGISGLSWIDAGTLTVTTAGADTTLTYGKTFTNTPVIWTTPQTYNQGGNIAAHVWAEDTATKSTTSAPLIGCTHQGTANACDTGTSSETVGYVAIDTANADISTFQTGSADISSSAWTAATFSPTYTSPRVMVTQNDDDGGEDPEYAWAGDVTTSGMNFRYCEEDAGDVCNSHTGEVTNWFAIEDGDITDGSGSDDTEAIKDWETYNNVFSDNWKNVTGINITVNVSVYTTSGSAQNGNNNPDLQLEAYNGSDFVNVGNFSVSGTGNFTLTVSGQTILTGWQTSSSTDLRIRGVDFDYNDSSNIDEINWTGIWIAINGTKWTLLGNHSNTTTLTWNTTNITGQTGIELRVRAIDLNGSNSYSNYFTKNAFLNISHAAADTTAPTWNEIPNNVTMEYYVTELTIVMNATEPDTSVDLYFTNDTARFNFTQTNNLTNTTTLSVGIYHLNVSVNNTDGLANFTVLNITVVDTIAPDFSQIPNNVSFTQGIESLNITINATDYSAINLFFTNDTDDFNFTWTNKLVNMSVMPIGVYDINVSVNDSYNNINSTIIRVTVESGVNTPPVVSYVPQISPQTITEGGMQQINITFKVTDADGLDQIDNNSAQLKINISGGTTRVNSSCLPNASVGNIISFNCTINIWYWDLSGNWSINASIEDTQGDYGANISTTFELYKTASMAMSPSALAWPKLEYGQTNKTSNIDPLIINNTGNKNITAGSITITGYDLQGTSTSTDFIDAGNFSIHSYNGTATCSDENCFECNGTILINQTSVALQVANISIGNNTINTTCAADESFSPTCSQEELFVCLHTIPSATEISRQTYDTTGTETASWVIAIS